MMTTIMVITWTVLFTLTLVAFWKGLIFRSKDEDVIKDSITISFSRRSSMSDVEAEKHEKRTRSSGEVV